MRILITNDDGVHDEGIAALERVARQISDDVWIVAPETDQSGLSHSMTLSHPIRMRKIGEKHYAVRGTPTDCVIMAVNHLMDEKPDLLLSGINAGANIADDVTYSGTVAGAIEGALVGIRAIALSQSYETVNGVREISFETAETYGPDIIRKLLEADSPPNTLFNVNFPACEPSRIAGTSVTRQGSLDYTLGVEERSDGRGFPYFWIRFGRRPSEFSDGTDLKAVFDDRISITPLQLDLTDHKRLDDLRALFAE